MGQTIEGDITSSPEREGITTPPPPICDPDEPGTMGVSSLSTNAVVGQQLTIQGWADPGKKFYVSAEGQCEYRDKVTYSAVTVTLDTGEQYAATATSANFGTWTVKVNFPQAGSHTVRASGAGVSATPLTVQVAPAGPVIQLLSLPTSSTISYQVTVRVAPAIMPLITVVQASVNGGAFTDMTPKGNGGYFTDWALTFPVATNPVAVNAPAIQVVIQASDPSGGSTATFQITPVDTTAAVVVSLSPPDGSRWEVLGTGGGPLYASIPLTAQITDSAGGVVSTGIDPDGVLCSVDGGTPTKLTRTLAGDPETWEATLFQVPAGPHVLSLTCKDKAGNVSGVVEHKVLVLNSDVRDTSEQSYLADLVDYVSRRFATGRVGGGSGQAGTSMVTPGHLAEALRQPFLGLTRVPAPVATAPTNGVRAVIEVVHDLLTAKPKAAIGHWPLDEGTGTICRDDTGAGSFATLRNGVSWGPGRSGGAGAVFDGSTGYAKIGSVPQLAVRSNGLTVTAWINPSRPGDANGSVIAGWENSYLLARFADGTIGWALAVASIPWQWIGTGAVAPQGTWSHVAMTYDGSSVRTFVNGARVHESPASGDIGPGSSDGFCIASRPDVATSMFGGSIAEVGVYDRPHSDTDIKVLLGQAPQVDVLGTAVASSGYASRAYQALLVGLGTSSEELRAAMGAPPAVRTALASRLGFTLSSTRPDELDQLVVPETTVTEANLERLLGLPATGRDPLSPAPTASQLQTWQEASLRTRWAGQDHATFDASDYAPPVIDPDIVTADDFGDVTGPMGQAAYALWTQRNSWLTLQARGLSAIRTVQPDAASGLGAMLSQVLPSLDLAATEKARAAGHSIADTLRAVQLDVVAFNRLVALSTLAAVGPLSDDEWADATSILVQVLKVRAFAGAAGWRAEEAGAVPGLGVLLDPAVFKVAPLSSSLPAWRASPSARVAWQDRLTSRAGEIDARAEGRAGAIAFAEQTALPALRDALVGPAPKPDELSKQLCVDVLVGPALTTTRLDQAVEALQGLLAAVDPGGDVSGIGVPWALASGTNIGSFFGEMTWMGTYRSWVSAMDVFFHPENHLDPSLRKQVTQSFQEQILNRLGDPTEPALTEQRARDLAKACWDGWPAADRPAAFPVHGFPTTEQLTEADLADLQREEIKQIAAITQLVDVPELIRESFFDLPVQLAIGLDQTGLHRAALGWLRTVYDYDQPSPHREIFAGFAIEPKATGSVTRGGEWLNDGALDPHEIAKTRPHAYLWFTALIVAGCLCDWGDDEFARDTAESRSQARALYLKALDVLNTVSAQTGGSVNAGLPPNPQLEVLTKRASLGLAKLRAGLNIAGLARPLGGISGDGDGAMPPATNYRYTTLLTRSQQVVNTAAPVEQQYLSSLEKRDQENYNLLVASQDLSIAARQITVANQQVVAAKQNKRVVEGQGTRAQTQSQTYQTWIDAGPNAFEQAQLQDYSQESNFRRLAANAQAAGSFVKGFMGLVGAAVETAVGAPPVGIAGAVSDILSGGASMYAGSAEQAGIKAQVDGTKASWERREDEWRLAKSLADVDATISREQGKAADLQVNIASTQAEIATAVHENALAKVNFLQQKFTNAVLYGYMSGVLGGVYRFLLQQATAIARLAEQQLAFERQVPVPGIIKDDYWNVAGAPVATGGLTGSARLLADVAQLDEYAADINQRKIQLTQTFSLAGLSPADLEQFRRTGLLPFATPLSQYERGLPGLYLATIRQVRVSVIALIPPAQGIRATLTNGGTSRIVVNEAGTFREKTLVRPSEVVAFTSATNATGLFNVDLQPELLLPFENCGVGTTWELRMPKAGNAFDYRTIADVQVSIDFTALYSTDYAATVIARLPGRVSNSVAFSLHDDFPDSWYRFVNEAGAQPPPTDPLLAEFDVGESDFPPNLSDLRIENVAVLVIRRGNDPASFAIDHLRLDGTPTTPTSATTVGDIVTSRNGSGANWASDTGCFKGRSPAGTWQLAFSPAPATILAVGDGTISDVVLVVSYGGSFPDWSGAAGIEDGAFPVPPKPVVPPASLALPTIAGDPVVEQSLTADDGRWSGTAPMTFSAQWQRCDALGGNCVDIPNATVASYRLGSEDAGSRIRVAVRAVNAAGSVTAFSAPTPAIRRLRGLWYAVGHDDGSWQASEDVVAAVSDLGRITAIASTSTDPTRTEHVAATENGTMWYLVHTANGWSKTPLPDVVAGRGTLIALGIMASGGGALAVPWANDTGELWLAWRASPWKVDPMSTYVGAPGPYVAVASATATPGVGEVTVATRDGRLRSTAHFPDGHWEQLDINHYVGDLGVIVAVAATSAVAGQVEYLAAAEDGRLWYLVRLPNKQWAPPIEMSALVGGRRVTSVAMAATGPGTVTGLLATIDRRIYRGSCVGATTWRIDEASLLAQNGPVTAVSATSRAAGVTEAVFATSYETVQL